MYLLVIIRFYNCLVEIMFLIFAMNINILFRPKSFIPAPISYPHHVWHNVVVPEEQRYHKHHHKHPDHVRILATPPPKVKSDHLHDPYLKTEEELKGKDFSEPFFYAYTKKIHPRKKDDGRPEKSHVKKSHHSLYL